MANKLEFYRTALDFKALAGDGQPEGWYEGYFSVFGNEDDGGDVALPGMFAKTLRERGKRVFVTLGHDWSKMVGPPPGDTDGGKLAEDEQGLYAKGKLTLDSMWGKEAWALLKDRALREGSFGYRTMISKPIQRGEGESARTLRGLVEVMLFELGFVPLGMNPLTSVEAVKAAVAALVSANEHMRSGNEPDPFDAKALGTLERCLAALEALGDQVKDGVLLVTASPDQVSQALDSLRGLSGAFEQAQAKLTAAEPVKPDHLALLRMRQRAMAVAFQLQR